MDELFNIGNTYFIFNHQLQLNKANSSDTETPILDLHLTISDVFVSSKIYDKCDDFEFDIVNKRDDFNFDTVNFPF